MALPATPEISLTKDEAWLEPCVGEGHIGGHAGATAHTSALQSHSTSDTLAQPLQGLLPEFLS